MIYHIEKPGDAFRHVFVMCPLPVYPVTVRTLREPVFLVENIFGYLAFNQVSVYILQGSVAQEAQAERFQHVLIYVEVIYDFLKLGFGVVVRKSPKKD